MLSELSELVVPLTLGEHGSSTDAGTRGDKCSLASGCLEPDFRPLRWRRRRCRVQVAHESEQLKAVQPPRHAPRLLGAARRGRLTSRAYYTHTNFAAAAVPNI